MNLNGPTTSFGASVALVLQEIQNIQDLCRSRHPKRLSFAIDVCLVAHGVRVGYLVDALCPYDPTETFRTLLVALRRKSAVFEAVVFWHHAPTTQSFLTHVPRLRNKIAALLGGATRECVFVKLDKRPSVLRDPPDALREALYYMGSVMVESADTLVHPLSELLTEEVLIPLVAVVIDYPVAYVPAFSAQTSYLEREPLDTYTVSFKWSTETTGLDQHALLKFSCPQILASDDSELSPSVVIKKLYAKFAAIFERVGACVFVTHATETLDRVAL